MESATKDLSIDVNPILKKLETANTDKKKIILSTQGVFEIENLPRVISLLRLLQKLTDTPLNIDVEKGSIKLILRGSEASIDHLNQLLKSKELLSTIKEELKIDIEDVYKIDNNTDKKEEVKLVVVIPGDISHDDILKLKKAISPQENESVEEDPYLISSLNHLAGLYKYQGRYSDSEPLYKKVLDIRKKRLGDEHPDFAASLNDLGNLFYAQGKYDEAESLYLQALDIRKKRLGNEHPDLAASLNDLGLLYCSQGKFYQAEINLQKALDLIKNAYGEQDLKITTPLNNLAELYRLQKNYVIAENFLSRVLNLRTNILGNHHPSVAISLNNLAGLYFTEGKHYKAKPLYIEALNILKQELGENHPHIIKLKENLTQLEQQIHSTSSNHNFTSMTEIYKSFADEENYSNHSKHEEL